MARVVALAECGTQCDLRGLGRDVQTVEAELTESLLTHLDQSMLLIADRGFFSYALWRKAAQSGADGPVVACQDRSRSTHRGMSKICRMGRGWQICRQTQRPSSSHRSDQVRVIDYTIDDGHETPDTYRLLIHHPRSRRSRRDRAGRCVRVSLGDRSRTFDELKDPSMWPSYRCCGQIT